MLDAISKDGSTCRTPANREDYDTMYQYIIWTMKNAGIAGDAMSYVAEFYNKAKKWQDAHKKTDS